LLEGRTVVKIAGQSTESGKVLANDEAVVLQNEYHQALQMEMIATGQDIVKAHRNVMTKPEYSGLALKLQPKPPGSAAGSGYPTK